MSDRLEEIRFDELLERSKDDGTIIAGSEIREVIGAYRKALAQLAELYEVWAKAMSQSVGLSYDYEAETFRNDRAELAEKLLAERDAELADWKGRAEQLLDTALAYRKLCGKGKEEATQDERQKAVD